MLSSEFLLRAVHQAAIMLEAAFVALLRTANPFRKGKPVLTVTAGTDTYGRVKTVGRISVVTRFAMLEFVPLYPLQSYYRLDKGHPLADPSVNHIDPLTRLDKTSVFLAYVRGLAGTLAVIGFFVIVPGIMILTGERLDGFALSATRGLLVALIAGLAIGALSYLIPLTSRREREIRLRCEELLQLAWDPARLPVALVGPLQRRIDQAILDPMGRLALIRELVRARIKIAWRQDVESMERRTDELLDQLSLSSLGKNYSTEVRSEAVERRPLV